MEKKFCVGDLVQRTDAIEKRAAGMSPTPLFECAKVVSVLETDEGFKYKIFGENYFYKEDALIRDRMIRKYALKYLVKKIEAVNDASWEVPC